MKKIYIFLIKNSLILLSVAGLINSSNAQTDLVGHWAMEEGDGAGVLTDSSTFANNGTVTGSLVQEVAQRAYGQDFDGSNDYVLVSDAASLDITNEITLAVWIKPAISGTQRIIRKVNTTSNDGYSLFLSTSGYFSIKFNDDNGIRVNTTALYSTYLNQWIHIAATYDGTTIRTYFNGNADNTQTTTFTIGTNNEALSLGAKAEDGGNKFNGEMDDARVYNYALTQTEINELLTTWSPPPSAELVGHWAMEENDGVGILTDSSNFSNDGNVTGSLIQELGPRAYGQDFDGSNDYVLVPDDTSLDITDEITLAVWIKPAITGTQRIIRKVNTTSNDGYSLFLSSSGYFSIKFNDDNGIRVNTTALYSTYLNQWIHIAATYDGTIIRTYFNGNPDNTLTSTFTIGTNNEALSLGAKAENGDDKFNGVMDDTRIYNYALTPTEISSLITTWGPPPTDDLVGHWMMEEGSGAFLVDSSVYINNGSISGAPTWVTGQDGLAMHFDGTSDYATVPDDPSLDITDEITLTAWIKPEVQGTQRIIRKVDGATGYSIFLENPSPSRVSVRFNGNNTYRLNSTSTYLDYLNTWLHVAATYDGSMIRLYLNGIKEDSLSASITLGTNNLPLGIGAANDGSYKYTGSIDDARVYNRALSTGEVQELAGYVPPVVYGQGYALDFDYTDDYVNCGNSTDFDMTSALTLEAWIRPDIQGTLSIIKKNFNGTGYGLYCSATGTVYGRFNENNAYRVIATTAYPNDGSAWMHAALTYDGSNMKIYINGELEHTIATSISIGTNSEDLIIGSDAEDPGGTKNFDGELDEIRIWNVARTQDDIKLDMYRELIDPASESNLIAYYRLNEGSGQIVYDASSNDHDATLGSTAGEDINDPIWVKSTAPVPFYSVLDGNWDANNTWATAQLSPVKDWSRVLINTEVSLNVDETAEEISINTYGALTVNSLFNLMVTDDFTIHSDNTGTGSFIDNGNLLVTGTTNVEKYYSDSRWHFISSPVTNAVSNIFIDIYLQKWHEDTYLWEYIIEIDEVLIPGKGYEMWSTVGNPTINYLGGILNAGDISPAITATDVNGGGINTADEGWNLVGNPFSSAIDLGAPGNVLPGYTWTNLTHTVYLWNGIQYSSYNPTTGISQNGGTQYVPSMQGFFVKADDFDPALTIPSSSRVHNTQANYKATNDAQTIKLMVEANGYSDEILIQNNPEATNNFDSKFDGYKMWGIEEAPQLYSIANGQKYSVNVREEILSEDVISLGFKIGVDGECLINATEIANLESVEAVILYDLLTNTVVDLRKNPSYSFYASREDPETRFMLYFSNLDQDIIGQNKVSIYSYSDNVYIYTPEVLIGDIAIYDILGQQISSQKNLKAGLNTIKVTNDTGYYLVKVQANGVITSEKVFIQ